MSVEFKILIKNEHLPVSVDQFLSIRIWYKDSTQICVSRKCVSVFKSGDNLFWFSIVV